MTPSDNDLTIPVFSPEDRAIQSDLAEKLSFTAKGILFGIMNPPECMHKYVFTGKGGIRTSSYEHEVLLNFIRNRLLGPRRDRTREMQKEFDKAMNEIREFVASFPT